MSELYIKSELFHGVNMLDGLADWEAGETPEGEYIVSMTFDNLEVASHWAQVLLGDD